MTKLARVLVADDEPDLIEDYNAALALLEPAETDRKLSELQDELFGAQGSNGSLPKVKIVAVSQGEAAVREISASRSGNEPFSVAFIDVRMPPGINGVEAAKQIRAIDPDLPIVIVTAFSDIQTMDLAKCVPPADRLFVLQKPFHTTEIQQLTIALTAIRALDRPGGGEGSGQAMARLLEQNLTALPGGVALFDEEGRLIRKNSALEVLLPEMKDQLSIGTRYSALRDSLSRQTPPDRVLRRAVSSMSEKTAQIADIGGVGLKRIGDNRWMMIAEQARDEGGAVVQFLDVTALKAIEQRREVGSTMTHIARFAEGLLNRVENLQSKTNEAWTQSMAGSREPNPLGKLAEELRPLAQNLPLRPTGALLDAIVNDVAGEFLQALGDGITLEVVSSVGLWPVCVDMKETRHAVHALVANAVEAVAEGGSVVVELANVRVTRETALTLPGLKEGDYVCTTISDTGPGMAPSVVSRAFMPYFTTKNSKHHSGTGLTRAFNLVTQSGGCLFIDSDGRSGTGVRLFFPRGPADAVSRAGVQARH